MMNAMRHRGPDDEGTFAEGSVAFGFLRLSILDLSSAGHQPMISDDGNLVLVFNGEIFNYIEIRDELKALNHTFRTSTDTEVLLHAYQEWGSECLHRFNGMWAFAIYNRKEKSVFASRDRFGVKPFYYYTDGVKFVFASEIPPILSALDHKPIADTQSIFDFLVFSRTDHTESTFFAGIKKLQHGCQLSIVGNEIKISKWYDLRSNLKDTFSSPDECRELFSSSVRLRLRSDVPVGVSLSGGIDSSSVVSVIRNGNGECRLNTFSAVYGKGIEGDESQFIDEFRPLLKDMYFTNPTSETLQNDLDSFVRAHAEPVPSASPYIQFKVMELAKGKVVVLLDGQGADEQFAGYHYFFGFFFKGLLKKGRLPLLTKEMVAYIQKHRSTFGLKAFAYLLLPKQLRTAARVSEKGYLNPAFVRQHENSSEISGSLYSSANLRESLIDHFEYKLEHLLKWEDRNSMWYSLEAREPFLDYRLVERALALPAEEVIKNGTTKHYFREAMEGILPERIRQRNDKIGFGNPQAQWFRSDAFRKIISEILDSQSFADRQIISPAKAKKMFQLHLSGKIDCAKEIWKWMNLELWFRRFFSWVAHVLLYCTKFSELVVDV
jgi:asparagine synthase (glutamine-hydrolysing)